MFSTNNNTISSFNRFDLLATVDEESCSVEEVQSDACLTAEIHENELDIEPKARIDSFLPSSASQEVTHLLSQLKNSSLKDIKQNTSTKNNAKRGFTLIRIGEKSKKLRMQDTTGIAEDFRYTKYTNLQIAQRHMWKRLNSFLVMAHYIHENAPSLTEIDFPKMENKQFTAQAYIVPSSYTKKDECYERAHISILNKIVVKQGKDLYLMRDQLTLPVKKIKTTIKKFFNLCDIVPSLINSVDWYAEYHLRGRICTFLSSVKNGSETFADAAYLFACAYGDCLIELFNRIRDKRDAPSMRSSLNNHFRLEMKKFLTHKEISLQYINGMLEAIIDFRTRYPTLKDWQNPKNLIEYPLYENIS